jgi:hypothetical protein
MATTRRAKLRLKNPIPRAKEESKFMRMINNLREYEHWHIIGQCLVPFVILGGVLAAAKYVHFKPAEQPAAPAQPAPVDPATWQRMTELEKIEPVVQQRLRTYNAAYMSHLIAEKNRTDQIAQWGSHLNPATHRELDQRCEIANREMGDALAAFYQSMNKYRELGGKIDYQAQMAR